MLGPDEALATGRWVKLIGGASNQDLASIEDLTGIYALAGVHCIDVAADTAVVAAARRGLLWAAERNPRRSPGDGPWLMVSLSDGADPHFRKAWFDARVCPAGCPRPCERVCPAEAIAPVGSGSVGVLSGRCYGCGRCLPACPHGLIREHPHVLPAEAVAPLLAELAPDAVELHTRLGRSAAFADRLDQVLASGVPLRRLAVSCGLEREGGDGVPTARELAAELGERHQQLQRAGLRPLWQLDGRPMSGDVGAGTAHAAVRLYSRVASLAPPGPLQLAGGTNDRTLPLLERLGPRGERACGVAFGSVARHRLQSLLLMAQARGRRLLDLPELLPPALEIAGELVSPWLRRKGVSAADAAG